MLAASSSDVMRSDATFSLHVHFRSVFHITYTRKLMYRFGFATPNGCKST